VLKVTPDKARLATEAAALERWTTPHSPSVIAIDGSVGALLLEAIDMASRTYTRRPELAGVVSQDLYERGRRLAFRLAEQVSPAALLHGDLTPRNILDGGTQRGLVAIEPAPCLGDLSFDAIDLVLWQADDVNMIVARAEELAAAIALPVSRLVDWCTAFAGMVAGELAEAGDARRSASRLSSDSRLELRPGSRAKHSSLLSARVRRGPLRSRPRATPPVPGTVEKRHECGSKGPTHPRFSRYGAGLRRAMSGCQAPIRERDFLSTRVRSGPGVKN
jgi:Aminoglycoside/hydroxyurea antibiotic resistance kinase